MSIFNPAAPAATFDEFSLARRRPARANGRGPRQLFGWAQAMPKPSAILIVSAHWESAPLALSSADAHMTPVYDFGGFAQRYYTMRYPIDGYMFGLSKRSFEVD